jgi:hypothetical protein
MLFPHQTTTIFMGELDLPYTEPRQLWEVRDSGINRNISLLIYVLASPSR